VALQALKDVLRNSDGQSPVIAELPFAKARDVSFFNIIFLYCFMAFVITLSFYD